MVKSNSDTGGKQHKRSDKQYRGKHRPSVEREEDMYVVLLEEIIERSGYSWGGGCERERVRHIEIVKRQQVATL